MENIEDIILETRNDLTNYLKKTEYDYVLLKFYADWCAPCKVIGPKIKDMLLKKTNSFKEESKKFIYIEIDVDECFDLYAFLKAKKMVRGIPTLFMYKKEIYLKGEESHMFIPQASISGAKESEIQNIINMIQ